MIIVIMKSPSVVSIVVSCLRILRCTNIAVMVGMVDTSVLKADALRSIGVQVPFTAPIGASLNSSFERSEGKEEWYTPPEIIAALGEFDLDPCSPIVRPWDTAKQHFNSNDDGLVQTWHGRVWLNPPYGNKTGLWVERLAKHGDGIAITFARTETQMFHRWVWNYADAVFFFEGRLRFYLPNGTEGGPAGAPSCLIAYGWKNAEAISKAVKQGKLKGKLIYTNVDIEAPVKQINPYKDWAVAAALEGSGQ